MSKLWAVVLFFGLLGAVAFASDPSSDASSKSDLGRYRSCEQTLIGPIHIDDQIIEEYVPEFKTVRRFDKDGRINPNIKLRILLIHGMGASTSNAKAMDPYLRYFSSVPATFSKGSVTKRLRSMVDENGQSIFDLAGAEAIDNPGHRFGAPLEDPQFANIDSTSDYYANYMRAMKKETPHLPLIVITRSAGALFAENVARRHPGLIDGMIVTSPNVPNVQVFDKALVALYEDEKKGLITINKPGLDFAVKLLTEARFVPETFGKTPSLILTGSRDLETDDAERDYYREVARTVPGAQYLDIPKALHDVVREDNNRFVIDHETGEYKLDPITGEPRRIDVSELYREKDLIATLKMMSEFMHNVVANYHPKK